MKYLAKIAYIGTNFCGFQVQPGKRTVMGTLSECLTQMLGQTPKITGCSRTDSGVHALGFCVTIECPTATIPADKLPLASIPYLPPDLSILSAILVEDSFHVRYDVENKTYVYRIYNSRVPHPMEYNRSWFLPHIIKEEDFMRMCRGSKAFLGTHDFSAFMSEGSDVTDTVRTIHSIEVEKSEDIISIRICADGFLYNMVRIIVGTLVEFALSRNGISDISEIILSKKRDNAGMTAPPEGLYLETVVYKNGFSFK